MAKAMRTDMKGIYFDLIRLSDELTEVDISLQNVCYNLPPERGAKEGLAHLAISSAMNEITFARHCLFDKRYENAVEELETAHYYLVWAKTVLDGEKKRKIEEIDNKLVSITITLKKII